MPSEVICVSLFSKGIVSLPTNKLKQYTISHHVLWHLVAGIASVIVNGMLLSL